MSKAIQQTAKVQRAQIDNVQRTHGKEMKAIADSHESRRADIKIDNERNLVEIQNENHKHVVAENEKKEKVLSDMRKNLEDTKVRTDKELHYLKNTSRKTTEDLQGKTSEDRQRITGQHETYLEDLNDKFNESSQKIVHDGQNRLEKLDDSQKESFSKLRDEHTTRLTSKTHEFNRRYTVDDMKHREFKDLQDNTFKKERATTNLRQQKDVAKLTKEHETHVQKRDVEFKKALKEQDVFLEKKWQGTMKEHEENFKNLDALHKKVVTQVKTDMSAEVGQMVKRSDDKFYQFSELRPVLQNFPDRVEIKVDVPEHSKQDVQLTTNNKEVVLVFNRRYQDTNKNELGTSKVHRVESYTSRINTDAILDPRSVKSTYDSGVMTYTIKKV